MAVAVQEYITDSSNSGTSVTAAGFASLATGNLMVSHLTFSATGRTITLPSGWTEVIKTEGSGYTTQIAYKVAVAGDVSGNSFAFSINGAAAAIKVAAIRITGNRTASPVAASSGQSNAASTTTTTTTITPAFADSLVMMFVVLDGDVRVSGYATATSTPTFTEIYDTALSTTVGFSAAAGTRAAVTATGSVTATNASSIANIGQAIIVSPPQDFTISETVTVTESFLGNLNTIILDTLALTDSLTTTISRLWTKLARNVKTWTNQNKD